MAPTSLAVAAAVSAPDLTLTQERFDELLKRERTIGLLVEFEYQDINDTKFTNAFCFERLATGAISLLQPRECEREKVE
jgi:hypothetical protein